MLGKSKCLRSIVATLGFIVSISAGQLMFPVAAQANCNGIVAATNDLLVVAATYARETPISGTCNFNGTYRTTIQSYLPGFRASLWKQTNGTGSWSVYYGPYTTAAVEVEYFDSGAFTRIHLCVNNASGTWYCGWNGPFTGGAGQVTHAYYGSNVGY